MGYVHKSYVKVQGNPNLWGSIPSFARLFRTKGWVAGYGSGGKINAVCDRMAAKPSLDGESLAAEVGLRDSVGLVGLDGEHIAQNRPLLRAELRGVAAGIQELLTLLRRQITQLLEGLPHNAFPVGRHLTESMRRLQHLLPALGRELLEGLVPCHCPLLLLRRTLAKGLHPIQ